MANCVYAAGFDVSQLALGTLTLATSGKTSVVIDLGAVTSLCQDATTVTTKYFHIFDASSTYKRFYALAAHPDYVDTLDDWAVVTYGISLRSAIRAAMIANSWVSPDPNFTLTYAFPSTFTFGYSATFSMTWSLPAGRALFGFTANSSGAATYTNQVVPTYMIVSSLPAVSRPTPFFEPESIATHVIPDDGRHEGYGIERMGSPLYAEWVQEFESQDRAHTWFGASTTNPWGFPALIKHCRGRFPFAVCRGFPTFTTASFAVVGSLTIDTLIFMLRSEGSFYDARDMPAGPANWAQSHIRFRCHAIAMMAYA